MKSTLVSRRYVIRGRVQGVGFRIFVQKAARKEGLDGQVLNRVDGSVEAVAAGGVEAIKRFEQALREGPPSARIEGVGITDSAPTGRGSGFSILP